MAVHDGDRERQVRAAQGQPDRETGRHFDAVVQPIDFNLDGARGWLETRRMRRAMAELLQGIDRGVVRRGGKGYKPGLGERRCVAHIRIERPMLQLPLMEYAATMDDITLDEYYRGVAVSRYHHLLDHHLNSAIFLPVDFTRPFYREVRGMGSISVGSSVRLREELSSLQRRMGRELDEKVRAMKDFVDARATELRAYATTDEFWVTFGFIVFSKLVVKSVECDLPVLLR